MILTNICCATYKQEQDQVFNDMNSMLENENQYQLCHKEIKFLCFI